MSFITSALVTSLLLTSANALYLKERRSDVSLVRRAETWKSLGCYGDDNSRVLREKRFPDDGSMTIETCQANCAGLNYKYAGVEFYHECYCGNTLADGYGLATGGAQCDAPCAGNSGEMCGGTWTIDIYERSTVLESNGDWQSQGCFVDSVSARILSQGVTVNGAFTPEACMSQCSSIGMPYAGLEYAQECYCAPSTLNVGGLTTSDQCTMPCSGDDSHICGGGNALNLYHSASVASGTTTTDHGEWASQGCYSDSIDARALPHQVFVEGGMTVDKCTTACLAGGFTLAGVEYGQECWCARAFTTSANSGQSVTEGCSMPCIGDSTEMCGGGNRLNVFQYGGTITTPAGPTVLETANGFNSVGCFVDSVAARVMTGITVQGAMTVESCTLACSTAGYTFAGVEWAQECYCSNTLPPQQADDASTCNMACAGDSAHLCGGGNRLNVYQQVPEVNIEPQLT